MVTKRKRPPEEPRGKYYIDPKAARERVASPQPVYAKPEPTVVSATEAARQFSDLVNRAAYQGERFVIERGGKPLCQIGPLDDKRFTMADFIALLSRLPRPDDEYLDAVEEYVRNQPPVEPLPWEK